MQFIVFKRLIIVECNINLKDTQIKCNSTGVQTSKHHPIEHAWCKIAFTSFIAITNARCFLKHKTTLLWFS